MARESWDYDRESHRVILNVRGDRYERRRRGAGSAAQSLLNRPRVIVLGVVLLALAFFFLREARFALANSSQFKIENIQIETTGILDQATVTQLLGLKGVNNLFSISAKELSRRLKKDPDVEKVTVEKKFPDTLRITVSERKPYIKIRTDSNEYLIDINGIVLWREREGIGDIPLILGIEEGRVVPGEVYPSSTLKCAFKILQAGKENGLDSFIEIAKIDIRNPDEIGIGTRENILIMAKAEDIEGQFTRLRLILADSQRRSKIIEKVDLRYKNVYVE